MNADKRSRTPAGVYDIVVHLRAWLLLLLLLRRQRWHQRRWQNFHVCVIKGGVVVKFPHRAFTVAPTYPTARAAGYAAAPPRTRRIVAARASQSFSPLLLRSSRRVYCRSYRFTARTVASVDTPPWPPVSSVVCAAHCCVRTIIILAAAANVYGQLFFEFRVHTRNKLQYTAKTNNYTLYNIIRCVERTQKEK